MDVTLPNIIHEETTPATPRSWKFSTGWNCVVELDHTYSDVVVRLYFSRTDERLHSLEEELLFLDEDEIPWDEVRMLAQMRVAYEMLLTGLGQ